MEQSIYNKHLILSMIDLINGYIEIRKASLPTANGSRDYVKDCRGSIKYLLNQTVRQFHIDPSHYLVSKGARECWDIIVEDEQKIEDCFYEERVKCKEIEHPEEYLKYIGASKKGVSTGITNDKGSYYFKFNDLFHCEHIVPVFQIVDTLLKLEKPTEASVFEVLDKIYICKMLKQEDRSIKEKSNRGDDLDYQRIVDTIYKKANIILE